MWITRSLRFYAKFTTYIMERETEKDTKCIFRPTEALNKGIEKITKCDLKSTERSLFVLGVNKDSFFLR